MSISPSYKQHDPAHVAGIYSVTKSGQPLADIIRQVVDAFEAPINYEETPYESQTDLQTQIANTIYGPRTLRFPPVTDFTATLSAADSTPYLAMHSVLAQHRSAGLVGANAYQVIQQSNCGDVLPYQVLGANGSLHTVKPVISTTISFPESERTIEDTFILICKQLSSGSGRKVLPISQPLGFGAKVTIGASENVVGDLLEKIGNAVGRTLYYQCLYDASDQTYYVNIYPIKYNTKGSPYEGVLGKAPTTPGKNIFFTKDQP